MTLSVWWYCSARLFDRFDVSARIKSLLNLKMFGLVTTKLDFGGGLVACMLLNQKRRMVFRRSFGGMEKESTTKAELESRAFSLQAELVKVRDVQHSSLAFEEARRLWIKEQEIQKELRQIQALLRPRLKLTE